MDERIDASEIDELTADVAEESPHLLSFHTMGVSSKIRIGADVHMVLCVACDHGCDLTGGQLTVCGPDGAIATTVQLMSFKEGESRTDPITLHMPMEPGTYTWSVIFEPADEGEAAPTDKLGKDAQTLADEQSQPLHERQEFEITLKAREHKMSVIAWGVIGAHLVAGKEAEIIAGARCDGDCKLEGELIQVIDADTDEVVAQGKLDYYGGPMGNFWCVDLRPKAPEQPGRHSWRIVYPGTDGSLHEPSERVLPFSVLAGEPDATVTARVRNRKGEALVGATVSVQAPGESAYKAKTDGRGIAKVVVPEGIYKVTASKPYYLPKSELDQAVASQETIELSFTLEDDYDIY